MGPIIFGNVVPGATNQVAAPAASVPSDSTPKIVEGEPAPN